MTNEEARKMATKMAIDLFTDSTGKSARRLKMDYSGNEGGTGWSIDAVEDRLTKAIQEASTARDGQTITVDGVEYGEKSVRLLQQQASECRAAGFIDDAGNVRKVLGTLPLTVDGAVVGNGSVVWGIAPHPAGWRVGQKPNYYCQRFDFNYMDITDGDRYSCELRHCYSTEQACNDAVPAFNDKIEASLAAKK